MIKAISSTGFIFVFLLLFISMSNVFGQEVPNNLPLTESENKDEIVADREIIDNEFIHQDQLKASKKPSDTQLKREKSQNTDDGRIPAKEGNSKNSILKSGTSLVTVFYVLVSYLFSGPLESPSNSNHTF